MMEIISTRGYNLEKFMVRKLMGEVVPWKEEHGI